MLEKAKVIASHGCYSLCELFIFDTDGNPISVGFGIFSGARQFVKFCGSEKSGRDVISKFKILTDCCHNFGEEKCRCPTCNNLLKRTMRDGKWTLLKCTNEQCDFEFTCGDVTTSKELQPPSPPDDDTTSRSLSKLRM